MDVGKEGRQEGRKEKGGSDRNAAALHLAFLSLLCVTSQNKTTIKIL